MHNFLLVSSTLVALLAPSAYVVSIIRGTSKPHRTTRFILTFVHSLNFLSILAAQGNLGARIFAGIDFVFALIVFLLSIRRGMGGTSLFDWACLVVAICGVIAWQLTGNAYLGIWLSIAANLVAYLPVFLKTWRFPDTESHWVYTLSILAALLGLLAFPISNDSIFQIYIILNCIVTLICIYHRKLFVVRL
jgi:hypothetical protein